MKKLLTILLILMAIGVFTTSAIAANTPQPNNIRVIVSGQEVVFTDQQPVIIDGRTLVPVRDVFEAMSFDVDWDEATSTALLKRDSISITIQIGEPTFSVAMFSPYMPVGHGLIHLLDVPAQIIGGRTMLPLRALLEAAGYQLDWNEAGHTITVAPASAEYGHGQLPPAGRIMNIRHLLRANMDDFSDLLGNQIYYTVGMWEEYHFDTGLIIGTDGQTIMSIWINYSDVDNRFHLDWIHGGSTFAEVEAQFGIPYFIDMREDAPPQAEGVFDPAFIAGFYLNEEIREFARFYFDGNNTVIGIRYFG